MIAYRSLEPFAERRKCANCCPFSKLFIAVTVISF
jgi:hypothetical protein